MRVSTSYSKSEQKAQQSIPGSCDPPGRDLAVRPGASTDSELPPEVRREALAAILAAHVDALEVLRRCAFSRAERRGLDGADERNDSTRSEGVPTRETLS